MNKIKYLIISLWLLNCELIAQSNNQTATQEKEPLLNLKNGIFFRLNEEGTHYIKMTFVNQTWIRWTNNNPGSFIGTTAFNRLENNSFDISLRRTRMQLFGQLTDRVFFYMQFGQNNFNFESDRKVGAFFHDVVGEYVVVKKTLSIGAGLTGFTGPSRFSSPSVASIMGMDAPLFEQTGNDVNDQFLRHLAIYAKGKLGKLDYRLALAKPMLTQKSTAPVFNLNQIPLGDATYSQNPPNLQYSGYFMYQFKDQEANTTAYTTGTYLGKKKVFNIGIGFLNQANAMWYRNLNNDTLSSAMRLISMDVYYDAPVSTKGDAISTYIAYFHNNMGHNFIRNLGVNNSAAGVVPSLASFNGAGNAFPIIGSGNMFFGQLGYKFKDGLLKQAGTIQPFVMWQYAKYNRLNNPTAVWDLGITWYLNGHNSKLSFDYQSRPIYDRITYDKIDRRGMFVIQYQVGIF